MKHTVLMGNPIFFRIKDGKNPYTRNSYGIKKQVNRLKAFHQWKTLKEKLEALGARVLVLQPQKEYPSMVFPSTAGFLYPKHSPVDIKDKTFYLSRLESPMSDKSLVYHQFFEALGTGVGNLPYDFEGESDFIPVNDAYIFAYGDIVSTGFRPTLSFPPWRYQFSHKSDERNISQLRHIVKKKKVIPIKLIDPNFYHGEMAMFAFGRHRENLLAYLPAMDDESQIRLKSHFGKKLIPIFQNDADNLAANSFQVDAQDGPHLILPSQVSTELALQITRLGLPYVKVDLSEFSHKGGGSVKALLCDLGPLIL